MRVVIVGGVAGGAGAAARLRRNDESAEIVLCEKGDYISFANCGLPYYVGGVITNQAALQLQTPESFHNRFHVDVRVGCEVTAVHPREHTVEVFLRTTGERSTLIYDKLVLSPGAKPVLPPIKGLETNRVFTLRNIPDTIAITEYITQHLPESCAVIGAGFIGLEMAENLAQLGIHVSVVEAAPHVLAPLDADMAGAVHDKLQENGISLYLNSRCVEITPDGVLLQDGTKVAAQMVLMSIGVTPETAFLKDSGIRLGTRGEILVDESLCTSEPDIYALGDAATVNNFVTGKQTLIPLAGPANKQARIVADVICGKPACYRSSQGTSVLKLYDSTVAVTGENEASLLRAGIPYYKSITCSQNHASYYPGGNMMCIKLLFSPVDGTIFGAQITGGDGVDKRIDTIASTLRLGGTIYSLQELELAYAPPFSSAKDPVNMAGYVAGNILEGTMKPFYAEDVAKLPSDALFIDVRTAVEYATGAIAGTKNIPLDELRERLEEISHGHIVYITCQVGLRGYLAQRILEQNGYNTRNLAGGYHFYCSCHSEVEADMVLSGSAVN